MKKLPVGIQTFRELIEGDYIYADKTEYIYSLINGGKYYFLSRPRRFGKSLLVDTMKEIFSGNRARFKGLWIDGSGYAWARRPVICLDMSQQALESAASLRESLLFSLKAIADEEGLELQGKSAPVAFRWLIGALKEKYKAKVVVLIDEYDKPIIDFLAAPKKAAANRNALGNFYGIIKGQDANLEFVFLTGVSKFTKTSLFSQLNNLTDLTLWDKYAGICGFTAAEFDALFADHIAAYREARKVAGGRDGDKSLAEIRRGIFDWYDGYTWDGETRVFNPFSLLSFFNKNEFGAYWYASGTPQFLSDAFRARPLEYVNVQEAKVNETMLDSYDIENAPLVSLLFQTGFLTVQATEEGPPREYALGFPNVEVSQSFGQQFLSGASEETDPFGNAFITGIRKALDAGEPEGIEDGLRGLYASIPYQLHLKAEAFYQVVFLATMQFLGFRVLGEISTAEGRMDGNIERPNGMTYVIEFKYKKLADAGNGADDPQRAADAGNGGADGQQKSDARSDETVSALLDDGIREAFSQIDARGYADRYAGTRRKVFKVAVCVVGRGNVRVVGRPGS
jgi:hypothetical protein